MKLTNAFADINVHMSGHLYDINVTRSADSWNDVRSIFGALASSLSASGQFNELHLEVSGPDHGIDITRRYGHSDQIADLLYSVLGLLPRTPKVTAALPAPVPAAEPILPAIVADQANAAADALFQSFAAELDPTLVSMHAGLRNGDGHVSARNGNGHSAHTKVDTAPAPEVAASEVAPICETCKQPKIKNAVGWWYCQPCRKKSSGIRRSKSPEAPTVHTVDPRANRATLSDLAAKDAIPAMPAPSAPPSSHILDMPACSPWSDEAFQNAVVSGIATTAFAKYGSFAIVKMLGHSHLTARHARTVQDSDTLVAMLDFNKPLRCWTAQPEFGGSRYRVPQEWINAKN